LLPLSIVQAAPRSDAARAKDKTKQTEEGFPVHSFRTLLADLGTLAKNRVRVRGVSGPEFYELTNPTALGVPIATGQKTTIFTGTDVQPASQTWGKPNI